MISKELGTMFVLSSPSGVGKTTLSKMLAKNNQNFKISVSHTTRKPRVSEKNGEDYFFVNKEKFIELINKDSFFEHAKIFENLYGTLKDPVLKNIYERKDVLFDIDWQGTQQLRKKIAGIKLVTIFILPPNVDTLKKRLLNRDQHGKQLVEQRMKKFSQEVSHWNEYNYVVINNDLNICYNQILSIIETEKLGKTYKFDLKKIEETIKKLIS